MTVSGPELALNGVGRGEGRQGRATPLSARERLRGERQGQREPVKSERGAQNNMAGDHSPGREEWLRRNF